MINFKSKSSISLFYCISRKYMSLMAITPRTEALGGQIWSITVHHKLIFIMCDQFGQKWIGLWNCWQHIFCLSVNLAGKIRKKNSGITPNVIHCENTQILIFFDRSPWSSFQIIILALFVAPCLHATREALATFTPSFLPFMCVTLSPTLLPLTSQMTCTAALHCCKQRAGDECGKHTWHYYTNTHKSVGDYFQHRVVIYSQCLKNGQNKLNAANASTKVTFYTWLVFLLLHWWIAAFKGSSVSFAADAGTE